MAGFGVSTEAGARLSYAETTAGPSFVSDEPPFCLAISPHPSSNSHKPSAPRLSPTRTFRSRLPRRAEPQPVTAAEAPLLVVRACTTKPRRPYGEAPDQAFDQRSRASRLSMETGRSSTADMMLEDG